MSPYAKHNKAPYQYSAEYQRWRSAIKSNDDRAEREANLAHRRRFAPHTMPKESRHYSLLWREPSPRQEQRQ